MTWPCCACGSADLLQLCTLLDQLQRDLLSRAVYAHTVKPQDVIGHEQAVVASRASRMR